MADWLADFRFSGDIWGYPEGEIYFPASPVVIVESTFGEAVVLETLLLSIYNHDSAVASAASRMTAMAADRPCIEMGSRRHMSCRRRSRSSRVLAGFSSTSNWRPAAVTGCDTRDGGALPYLLHATEREAFAAQIAELGEQNHIVGGHL